MVDSAWERGMDLYLDSCMMYIYVHARTQSCANAVLQRIDIAKRDVVTDRFEDVKHPLSYRRMQLLIFGNMLPRHVWYVHLT